MPNDSAVCWQLIQQHLFYEQPYNVAQDGPGNYGGCLVLSTSTAGSSRNSVGQPVDRLTIDSAGLATFTAGQLAVLLSEVWHDQPHGGC